MKNFFLFFFILLQILLMNLKSVFAEDPKNYFKGKFYESVENYLLVSTKKMRDSRFEETVILILNNDENGAWGLVINKPMGNIRLGELINITEEERKSNESLYNSDIPIYWGGPVDTRRITILHSKEYKNDTTEIHKDISISGDYNILFDIAKNKGPEKSMVILGYAGWGSRQLEGEMERGGWTLSETSIDFIFDEYPDKKWLKASDKGFIRL